MRFFLWAVGLVIFAAAAVYVAFQISPWPAVLVIRHSFEQDARRVTAALAVHLPADVSAQTDIQYSPGDRDAYLDVYYPSALDGTERTLPTVVWTHGGAWISGSRANVADYLKILAGYGYTTVSVGYSVAPGARYPTPIRQANAALAYLKENGGALHVDASRLVLAGDSAGAQIAAQMANIVSAPSYAAAMGVTPAIEPHRLQGVVLFCGAYDITKVDLNGGFGGFIRTVLWAYSGTGGFATDPTFATISVARYVTDAFPAAFISAGNGDPLAPQSHEMATALGNKGVAVDTLFFPDDTKPPLPHEYQFNLDTEAGQLALERTVAFLGALMPRD